MRTSIKIAAYAGVLGAAFAAAFGAGNLTGSPVDTTAEQHTHDSSNAEQDTHDTHDTGTAEPVVASGLQVSESGYTLSAIDAPARPGTRGALSFTIAGPDGAPVTDFTESHERELHLIIVRTDTAHYRHVHPTIDSEGTWSIDWEWAAAGTYKVFVDFVPTALGDGLTLARTVGVAGEFAPGPFPADSDVFEIDGYTVTLDGHLVAGEGSRLTARFERDGEPVTDLEPYLGAYGHLVALRAGDLGYVHVHPDGEPGDGSTEPGPEVTFHVEAPTAGRYRLFLDFQVDGEVRVAEFTVPAAARTGEHPDERAGDDAEGGHGH